MKKIAILGSTGSIGVTTLSIIKEFPEKFQVVALAAGKNFQLLARQAEEFSPKLIAVLNRNIAKKLKTILKSKTTILYGTEGYRAVATIEDADTVVSAIVGSAGLLPTYWALEAGKEVALANKESMVMAGKLIVGLAQEKGTSILPVDSEHSAIFQALQGQDINSLNKVILTASGGPFRNYSIEQLKMVTPEEAINHPNWKMGPKISVDSATLINKGLEAIEAKWLFDLIPEQIEIVIHPQSIVHSLVEFKDGSLIAQMGPTDMKLPIAYALSYPQRISFMAPKIDLTQIGRLEFFKPDMKKFPALELCLKALKAGDWACIFINAANELAVKAFLKGEIGFMNIADILREILMYNSQNFVIKDINDVVEADKIARKYTQKIIEKLQNS